MEKYFLLCFHIALSCALWCFAMYYGVGCFSFLLVSLLSSYFPFLGESVSRAPAVHHFPAEAPGTFTGGI